MPREGAPSRSPGRLGPPCSSGRPSCVCPGPTCRAAGRSSRTWRRRGGRLRPERAGPLPCLLLTRALIGRAQGPPRAGKDATLGTQLLFTQPAPLARVWLGDAACFAQATPLELTLPTCQAGGGGGCTEEGAPGGQILGSLDAEATGQSVLPHLSLHPAPHPTEKRKWAVCALPLQVLQPVLLTCGPALCGLWVCGFVARVAGWQDRPPPPAICPPAQVPRLPSLAALSMAMTPPSPPDQEPIPTG